MSTLRQPAHVPTAAALSMTASSSSSSTVTNKAQRTTAAALSSKNWRGKYLRALNISTPEVDVGSRKKQPLASVNTSDLRSQQQPAQQARRLRANLTNSDNNNSKSVSVSRSFSTSTDRDGNEFQAARVNRYQAPQTARYSHRRALITREQLTTGTNKTDSYGFALKPDLARGRRCHTDPFVVSDGDDRTASASDTRVMASAPIQIPTSAGAGDIFSIDGKLSDFINDDGGGATMANNNYKSKRYGSKSPVKIDRNNNHNKSSNKLVSSNNNNQDAPVGNLLSWEEPAVMMIGVTTANINNNKTKPGDSALSGGLDMAFSSLRLNGDLLGGVNNNSNSINNGDSELFCNEFVETEDEDEDEEDDLDENDDEDDEIFEMEDFDSDTSNNNSNCSSKSSMFNSSSSVITANSKARRRRTASASQATATSPDTRRSAALPRYHSVRQMRSHGTLTSPSMDSTTAMKLPESFVPPHQLIQRDCFSIGLRDEFKRRQPKI